MGAELAVYRRAASGPLAHITGVDPNPAAARAFPHERDARLLCMEAGEIRAAFPPGLFTKAAPAPRRPPGALRDPTLSARQGTRSFRV